MRVLWLSTSVAYVLFLEKRQYCDFGLFFLFVSSPRYPQFSIYDGE